MTRELSGEGVILLGPGRNQGPEWRVGGKDPVVTVAVNARWRKDLGQAVQEFESGETQGGAAGEVGPREEVEDLVGTVADQVEAIEGEGWTSTIPDQSFQSGAVGGLDTDAGIETEPRRLSTIEDPFGVRRAHEPKGSNPPP
jgi:hypothetical protein